MMTIEKIQTELAVWQKHNFPRSTLLEPFAGIVEEIGELVEANNAYDAGKGTMDAVIDAIGDIVIYTCDACNRIGISAQEAYDSRRSVDPMKRPIVFAGMLLHAALKLQQGIRGTKAEHVDAIKFLFQELFDYLQGEESEVANWPVEEFAAKTWARVSKRDWVADPRTGGA
jgi:NTP pyrophosphatase (non-canonical NTP hydrolase)